MSKLVVAGVIALTFVAASPVAYAQAPSAPTQAMPNAAELNALTDARIAIVKAALQLTPDQEKMWPAIEEAVRARATGRQARVAAIATRVRELRDRSAIDILRDRNPVEFLRRRSNALAQRSAELKKLADAWQPLYATLSQDQKRRLGILTVYGLRELRDAVERRRMQDDEEEDFDD